MNLILPFLLLIFLFCAVNNAVELEQKFLITKPVNKLTKIECTFPSECGYYIHWYQKKDDEPFKRVQYVNINSASHSNDPGFGYLQSEKTASNKFVLIIPNVQPEHSATYYCACWVWGTFYDGYYYGYYNKIFGSGTRLIVTDTGKNQVKRPQVSVFPVSNLQENGKAVMLCQAKCMFPDLVKFTWQAEDRSGRKVELKDTEQLEQSDEDQIQITSMLIVDIHKAMNNKFICSVQHDSSFDVQRFVIPRAFELSHNLYLFSMSYVILLVKNVLYFCILSVLLSKTNQVNKEMVKRKAKRTVHKPKQPRRP
ncbi:hypothetical protein KOW79_006145 [Hemibagrus wyckioides]|uniref:Ig-like domain-containing protein n=1 Tax=Hemibagrus wyckioides TaxID=337641 RepID=A0A9D3NZ30_9TELE|nr:hypothetical protein KOW79_006145 [Hemibagrus wyckioides]